MSIMPLSLGARRIHHGVVTTARLFRVIAHGRTAEERRIDRRQRRQARRVLSHRDRSPGAGSATLLLVDPHNPQRLTAGFNRRCDRFFGLLFASSLDRQLAQGRSPESNRLLAARAQLLVSPAMRRALAQNWEHLVGQARTPPVQRDPRVPLNRARIIACEPAIQEMLNALLAPLPVPARGPAMVSCLLSDGTGPLYDRRCSTGLGIALREATEQLDPSGSLVSAAWNTSSGSSETKPPCT